MKTIFAWIFLSFFSSISFAQKDYDELYRPQAHFSPKQHWMNDPNGMVFYKGIYHLFFQYYPGASVWGPMHWGHATSTDLVHWRQQPVALFPDTLGYIFSGSAVVDSENTSGFGINGRPPLVAIYTNHDTAGEHAKTTTFQYQSIAYSNDNGMTWKKYKNNPVLKNPGIVDFRDPSVMWYAPDKKWIMTLAIKDHVTFYSSKNLKDWNKETEFGQNIGAHGGVWECPNLFSLNDGNKTVWVLIVSIGANAPNGGSGTQYFLGSFDGHEFTPDDSTIRWIDYGPDDYAGVTWNNTGSRKIFLGWMSNWLYAAKVPTTKWRSAMTIPRELALKHVDNNMYVSSEPVTEIKSIEDKPVTVKNIDSEKKFDLATKTNGIKFPCRINLKTEVKDLTITLENNINEKLLIGYDESKNQYYIDRTHSGKTAFYQGFSAIETAPRLSHNTMMNISLIIDESSLEFFADKGLTVMTVLFFPDKPYTTISLKEKEGHSGKTLTFIPIESIW